MLNLFIIFTSKWNVHMNLIWFASAGALLTWCFITKTPSSCGLMENAFSSFTLCVLRPRVGVRAEQPMGLRRSSSLASCRCRSFATAVIRNVWNFPAERIPCWWPRPVGTSLGGWPLAVRPHVPRPFVVWKRDILILILSLITFNYLYFFKSE